MEVHSHKTKKGALITDLAQRYGMRGTFKDPRDLDRHLAVVEEKKRLLTNYAALINKTIEPFNATVFEILWARDRCGQDIAAHREKLSQIILPVVLRFTRTQFTQAEQFLSVYAQHLAAVLAPSESLDQHPWAWIAKPLAFEEEENILVLLAEFLHAIERADKHCAFLEGTAGITLTRTAGRLQQALTPLALLPESDGPLIDDLMAPCQIESNRTILTNFLRNIDSFRHGVENLASSTGNISSLLAPEAVANISSALGRLHYWGLEERTGAEVQRLLAECEETTKLLQGANSSFRLLLGVIGCDTPATQASAGFLLETVRIIEGAPFEHLHLRQLAFEKEETKPKLHSARQEAMALKEAEAALGGEFDLSLADGIYTTAQLLECAAAIDEASLWRRLIGSDYKRRQDLPSYSSPEKERPPRTDEPGTESCGQA
jgi:hypothetical protein